MTDSKPHDGTRDLVPPKKGEEDPSCLVKNVVPTSTVFAAALERLNRQSVIHLLQQIIHEVDQHCQLYARAQTAELGKTVSSLIDSRLGGVDLKALRLQLEQLTTRVDRMKQGSSELTPPELKQVEALVLKLLSSYDLTASSAALKVTVNGRSFSLERLIEVLATVDKVVDTHIDYSDTDLTGARMVLTDRTQILFVCTRREQLGGKQIHYLFFTPDWKGVPASFTLLFERRDTEMQVCGRTVVLTSYDGVFQSNIQFDLCQQAGGRVI
jgi:hypothetical protein